MKDGRGKMLNERLTLVSGRTQPGIRYCRVYKPDSSPGTSVHGKAERKALKTLEDMLISPSY